MPASTQRQMTEEERGTLLGRNRGTQGRGIVSMPALMVGVLAGLLLGVLCSSLGSIFPLYAERLINVGVPAGLAFTVIFIWLLNRTVFRPAPPSSTKFDPVGPYADDLRAGVVLVTRYTASHALRVCAGNSTAFILDIGEGKLLFLRSAGTEALAGRFPCRSFSVIYLPNAWEVLRIECEPGEPIPEIDLSHCRFPDETTFPRDGDVIEGTLAEWSTRFGDNNATSPAAKPATDRQALPAKTQEELSARLEPGSTPAPVAQPKIGPQALPTELHPDLLPIRNSTLGSVRTGMLIGAVLVLGSAGRYCYLVFFLSHKWNLPDDSLAWLIFAFVIGLLVLINSLVSPMILMRDLRRATMALHTQPSVVPVQVYYYPSTGKKVETGADRERTVTVCLPGPFAAERQIPNEFRVYTPGGELEKGLLGLNLRTWDKPAGYRYQLLAETAPVYLGSDGMVVIRTRKGLLARSGD